MNISDGGNNRVNSGRKNEYDTIQKEDYIVLGDVVSVIDPNSLGRIKVRVKGPRTKGGDDGISDKDLAWCFPMLPKFFGGQPKIGEAVFILTFNKETQFSSRMFFGPIISQPQQLKYDPYDITALAAFQFGSESPNVSVNTIPEIKGVFPNPEDISIQGRFNTDIIQKSNEVVIRAGKFVPSKVSSNNPYPFKFNGTTQGYIQIRNDVQTQAKTSTKQQEFGTVTNIVSSKINLLTHKDGTPRFSLTNQDNLISDEELNKILESAHQLPFGDIVLEYLKLFKDAFFNHVHNGNGNQPTELIASGNKLSVAEFKAKADDLEKRMLSKNVRIN